jgi:glyoxylase-like metal-dependent hydrolase (beta-lactamase superfamily II)
VIYVTHGHPDHYLGLEILTKEFPEARVLSTKDVAAYIKNTGQETVGKVPKLKHLKILP